MREVDLRAVGDARRAAATVRGSRASSSRRAAPSTSAAGAGSARRSTPRPGPPAPRRCLRTATAGRDRCRTAARRRSSASRMAARHSPSSAAVAAKCPTPGTTMPRRRRDPRASRRVQLGARGGEALADRRQVAGAVVDERDHSSSLVLGQRPRQPPVLRARVAQRAGERLEHRFDLVVAGAAVEHLHVDVGAGALREAVEEVVHQLRLRGRRRAAPSAQIDDGVDAAAEIDGGDAERFVHRHHEVAGAVDAAAVAERLRDRLAERDADVLDGVVLIDVEVAGGLQRRSKPPCRVTSSSMWSKNRMPVETSYRPLAVERQASARSASRWSCG